jgi:hypothetical protein
VPQVLLDKTRSFVSAWASRPSGTLIDDVNDWLTCMTADAVVKAAMGLVGAIHMCLCMYVCMCMWKAHLGSLQFACSSTCSLLAAGHTCVSVARGHGWH